MKLITSIFLFLFFSINCFAKDSDTLHIVAKVSQVSEISFANGKDSVKLSSLEKDGQARYTSFKLSNNNPNGFVVTLSSESKECDLYEVTVTKAGGEAWSRTRFDKQAYANEA